MFQVLELCSVSDLIRREQAHMDAFKRKYNSSLTAGRVTGVSLSPEARHRLSAAHKGKAKSVETKLKMSAYAKCRDPDHTAKLATAATGKRASEATRAKQSALKLGTQQTPVHVTNSIAGRHGKPSRATQSGFKGVSKCGTKWVVRISLSGVYKNLGRFTTLDEAAAVAARFYNTRRK